MYGGDQEYRLKQEIVLGVGGVRMLQALGFKIRQYHLNEGHSALLAAELLRRNAYPPEDVRPGKSPYDIPRVREMCNFTAHTPVEAGHDKFPYGLVQRLMDEIVDLSTLKRLAAVHATGGQRMVAVIPLLIFTILPDQPEGLAGWLGILGFLLAWLAVHWLFELDADRRAARLVGTMANQGLRDVHAATRSPLGWLTPRPQFGWRLRAVTQGLTGIPA